MSIQKMDEVMLCFYNPECAVVNETFNFMLITAAKMLLQ